MDFRHENERASNQVYTIQHTTKHKEQHEPC
jgi:hypothetical protein